MKTWPLFFIAILFAACNHRQKENQKNIIGTWQHFRLPPKPQKGKILMPPPFDVEMSGLRFDADGTLENKDGYYTSAYPRKYIGNLSKYKITADSLKLYDPGEKKWSFYKILKLNKDTLFFKNSQYESSYIRFKPDTNHQLQFDSIILSSSGCYGTCPAMNLLVSRNGIVKYEGMYYTKNKGNFASIISSQTYLNLQNAFTVLNINNLNDSYSAMHTDDETITITFIKEGRIYKSIFDYGHYSPKPFRWAYLTLRMLPEQLKLSKLSLPAYFDTYNNCRSATLVKDKLALDIWQSETFLLMQYLQGGRLTNNTFLHKYQLHFGYGAPTMETDGRYFQLKDYKTYKKITIDIGFNFFTTNIHRPWQALTEYDN